MTERAQPVISQGSATSAARSGNSGARAPRRPGAPAPAARGGNSGARAPQKRRKVNPKAVAELSAILRPSMELPKTLQVKKAPDGRPMVCFRPYQEMVFRDRFTGVLVLHWSRQIGKSFTLAAWAVDRLIMRPGRLVTVLSNSRDNGGEFAKKAAEVLTQLGYACEEYGAQEGVAGTEGTFGQADLSTDWKVENMRFEVRLTLRDPHDNILKTGRIKVLAANPRTARGFSGDLILDEFGFHEDSAAIWDAAEPILSSNPDFLCRIASTGNGRHNMFYRQAAGEGPYDGQFFTSAGGFRVCRVSRSEAYKQGVKVYSLRTRQEITPEEAEAEASDKASYRQNYECEFADANAQLLPLALIVRAERAMVPIDNLAWSAATIARLYRAIGDLECGMDVGRVRDLSVIWVNERRGRQVTTIAVLRMEACRLPHQCEQVGLLCGMPKFRRICIDATGLGIGVVDFCQEKHGSTRVVGINFASTEPITNPLLISGEEKRATCKVTEAMAVDLLTTMEANELDIPCDQAVREDLQKPERIVSPGGKVSIAAVRDDAGHADHFWALALSIRAGKTAGGPATIQLAPMFHHGLGRSSVGMGGRTSAGLRLATRAGKGVLV